MPLGALSEDAGGASLLADRWLRNYLLAEATDFHNGVLYSFPFSAVRKLLVVSEKYTGATTGWRFFVDSLGQGSGSLALDNDFDEVGPWYDWLEVVTAHGGTDFRRPDRLPRCVTMGSAGSPIQRPWTARWLT